MKAELTNKIAQPKNENEYRNRLIAGVALIAFGLLAIVPQVFDMDMLGLLFLPALAVVFLAWSLMTRTFGLLIPGGVLAGIGLGAFLIDGPLSNLAELETGGLFFLAFAAGWALILLLSPLTEEGFQWWPAIPGSVMVAMGGLLLAGDTGLQVLKVVGYLWPLALIVGGVALMTRRHVTG